MSANGGPPLVGVVTPVRNTAKYLAEAIESVLAQTYQRWEYAIVDNGSTDGSLEIARGYAERDPRIRVHALDEVVGVLQSLNRTVRHLPADADYCKVVCADDWLFPECLERMVAMAAAHPEVGIVGAYRLDEDEVNLDGIRVDRSVVPGRELGHDSLMGGFPFVFGSPTSTIIRADLVRGRASFYNEDNLHSDVEACYDLLRTSDFGFVHQVLTFTRRHNESNTSYARRLNTFLPAQLGVLVRYGPDYLTLDGVRAPRGRDALLLPALAGEPPAAPARPRGAGVPRAVARADHGRRGRRPARTGRDPPGRPAGLPGLPGRRAGVAAACARGPDQRLLAGRPEQDLVDVHLFRLAHGEGHHGGEGVGREGDRHGLADRSRPRRAR